jgi:hypothetical protein
MLKKKIWPNFPRIIEVFTQKTKSPQKYGFGIRYPGSGIRDPEKTYSGFRIGDPRSGKNLFRIPDPGVKKAPDPGSRIRIRNTGWE